LLIKGLLKSYLVTAVAMFAALVTAGITLYYNTVLGIIELILVLLLLVIGYLRVFRGFRKLSQQVSALNETLKLEDQGEAPENAFPFPLALCNQQGNVVWYNSLYDKIIVEQCGFEQPDIGDCLAFEQLTEGELPLSLDADIRGNFFTVFPIRTPDGMFALYFVDDSELKNFRIAYLRTRPVAFMINIDSLDNTEDTYSHIDFSTIHAEIDRIISAWLAANGCVYRRYSDGRYFALTEYDNFQKISEKRFELLDTVRAYRFDGQDSGLTLSIGVGMEPSFRESENSARQALDMARGRGGDQVAIKTDDSFEFIGGITSKKDKRGKIRSRSIASALCELIEKADNVLLMGHSFSDFDAVGSCIGLSAMCSVLGVKANIVINEETTLAQPLIDLCEQNGMKGLFVDEEVGVALINENTLLIVADILRPNNVESRVILENVKNIAVIDHHRMAVDKIESPVLLFHDPYASSCAEMVTELIQYAPAKPKLTPVQAESLMAGIILDTKNFTFRVGVRTFEAAAFLRERKTDTVRVKKLFALSEEEKLIVNKIALSAKICENYAVAFTDSRSADIRKLSSQAADDLLEIKGVEASFVVYLQANGVAISARSLGSINVQLIMEKLGGGGHQSMAGAQLRDATPQQAMEKLSDAIKHYFHSEI